MILETINVGSLEVNCYVLALSEGSDAIIIDPGAEPRKIKKALDKHKLTPALIINTHGHYDHIGADDSFNLPVYVHDLDAQMLKDPMLNLSGVFGLAFAVKSKIITVKEGDFLEAGGLRLKVLHVPGHTPGGIALISDNDDKKIAFTGDSLFCQGIGRTDLDGGDEELLKKGIKTKLLSLNNDTVVYPGHGPSTTIQEEKENNPFFS